MPSRRTFMTRLAGAAVAAPALNATAVRRLLAAETVAGTRSAAALADDEDYWGQVQRAFDADRTVTNLNNGGVSPAPSHVLEAMIRDLRFSNEIPVEHMWGVLEPRIEVIRRELALDFGCDPEELAIVRNASEANETMILGLDLAKGDEIIVTTQNYPRMLTTWEQRERRDGIVLKRITAPVNASDAEIVRRYREAIVGPRTRAIVYNDLQNPIGAESSAAEREAIARLAIEKDLWVLSDEAYFEMRYSGASTSIAQLPGMAERTVILYTFSKKFAMTGWRLGAAIAPAEVAAVIAKLNTNDESCTTHFVQYGGVEAIRGDQSSVARMLDVLRERRDVAVRALNAMPGVSVHSPEAAFYLFPDVTDAMARKGIGDLADFAQQALHATGVSFCTRRHFGREQPGETRRHVRFAFSGIDAKDITEGLELLGRWIAA